MQEEMAPAPMEATQFLNTTPVPSPQVPVSEVPSMGVSTYAPDPASDDFMPAYENEYAEIEDNKDPVPN
jgi:hypothetical protein